MRWIRDNEGLFSHPCSLGLRFVMRLPDAPDGSEQWGYRIAVDKQHGGPHDVTGLSNPSDSWAAAMAACEAKEAEITGDAEHAAHARQMALDAPKIMEAHRAKAAARAAARAIKS